MRLAVIISSCLSLALTSLFAKSSEFSQTRDLPPLRLVAPDLDVILHKTKAVIAAANGAATEKDSARESVKLAIGGRQVEMPHFSVASSVAFPRELFGFCYTYHQSDKPISSVTIDLGDYSRRVSVTGESAEQVEVISNLVENDLLRYSIAIGGTRFRRVIGICLTAGLLTSLGLSGVYWWRTRACNALGILICSTVSLLLVLLVPWHRYLPGFVLYQSYSPFLLIKYAPQIFFLSLVAAVLGIPLSYFFLRGKA